MRSEAAKYLTAEVPGTGGVIKEAPEDFVVTEIPLYQPCGDGEHLYLEFEKRGITTLEAIRRLARALQVPEREIGYAGMKDSRGVTRQTVSIPRVTPAAAQGLALPGIKVLSAVRHRNKLRLGHLAGNRFRIRVRGVGDDALSLAEAALAIMSRRGVPNFFGSQRYGGQGNSHLIGMAMLRRDWRGAVEALIGDPAAVRDERWSGAIEAFRRGGLEESIQLFPGHCRTEREVLQRLARQPDGWDKAFQAVHPRLKKLYLSAVQSWLFDAVVARRLSSLDLLVAGDIACKHDNGACFLVADVASESGRALVMEISPTGPMFGSKMLSPQGEPLAMEEALLRENGLCVDDFRGSGVLALDGERRPLRIPVAEPSVCLDGDDLVVSFSLPKGAYATSVLREVMKTE